ncbi:transcription antitermination factor NusB [bacterium]|nr:transcription antitermination factor NusB [bacterium]
MSDKKNVIDDLNIAPVDQELDAEALLQAMQQQQHEEEEDLELKIKMSSRRDERHLAFYLLYAVDRSDYAISLEEALENFEAGFECAIPRQSFPVLLVQGTITDREAFNQQLVPHLKNWSLERLGCCTKLILHMAMWELAQPNAIPSIVINEAVELAKEFAEKDAYKFINGILDEMLKKKGEAA